jgi:hypothetical protein
VNDSQQQQQHDTLPNGTHLGPVASSYELIGTKDDDDTSQHVLYDRQALPQPSIFSQVLFIGPIMIFVNAKS